MKPPGFSERKTWPLVLEVHGGPETMYGVDVHARVSGAGRARVRGAVHQPARQQGLRRGVRGAHLRRLGQPGRRRLHGGCRRGVPVALGRHGSTRRHRRLVRRLHDDLAGRPYRSLPRRGLAARAATTSRRSTAPRTSVRGSATTSWAGRSTSAKRCTASARRLRTPPPCARRCC